MQDGGPATVLFVDDEPLELELYADYFDREPAVSPLLASTADEALATLESTTVDCLVSDGIQTRDGESFVTVVKQRYPGLGTILYSGTGRDSLAVDAVERYLWKGASDDSARSMEILAATIREMTEAASRSLHAEDDDEEWEILGHFPWASDIDVGSTIVQALADRTGRDIVDLPPLYDVIDSDALSRLVTTATSRETDPSVMVQFGYADQRLRVSSDGIVSYRPSHASR